MSKFDGKVVLVTGGNRNTGLDIVEKFAREGAKVLSAMGSDPMVRGVLVYRIERIECCRMM
jgi:NAD(P)-dependent dehydrogenase (short-subunit alcohol dehydrogenase family)